MGRVTKLLRTLFSEQLFERSSGIAMRDELIVPQTRDGGGKDIHVGALTQNIGDLFQIVIARHGDPDLSHHGGGGMGG